MSRIKLLNEKSLVMIQVEVDGVFSEVSDDILRKVFCSKNCLINKITTVLASSVLKKIYKTKNPETLTRCIFSEIAQNVAIFFRLTSERLKRKDEIVEQEFKDNLIKVILYSNGIIPDTCSQIASYCDYRGWYISYEESIKLSLMFVFDHEKYFVFEKGEVLCKISDEKYQHWIEKNIQYVQLA